MTISPKELLEESKTRRTYRKFLEDDIDLEVIKACIMTAATAPSGADKQPWHFCVVTDADLKKKIQMESEKIEKEFYKKKITQEWKDDLQKLNVDWRKPFLNQAPCLIVIFKEFYKLDENGLMDRNYYVNESVGIAIGLLINAIRNAGYVSLPYTPAPPHFLSTVFERPEGETPVMVLCVGKPDLSYELPALNKKVLEEVATFY